MSGIIIILITILIAFIIIKPRVPAKVFCLLRIFLLNCLAVELFFFCVHFVTIINGGGVFILGQQSFFDHLMQMQIEPNHKQAACVIEQVQSNSTQPTFKVVTYSNPDWFDFKRNPCTSWLDYIVMPSSQNVHFIDFPVQTGGFFQMAHEVTQTVPTLHPDIVAINAMGLSDHDRLQLTLLDRHNMRNLIHFGSFYYMQQGQLQSKQITLDQIFEDKTLPQVMIGALTNTDISQKYNSWIYRVSNAALAWRAHQLRSALKWQRVSNEPVLVAELMSTLVQLAGQEGFKIVLFTTQEFTQLPQEVRQVLMSANQAGTLVYQHAPALIRQQVSKRNLAGAQLVNAEGKLNQRGFEIWSAALLDYFLD